MQARIKEVMSKVFNIDSKGIVEETSPDTVEMWDSLRHMQMVLALEEEFSITFSEDQILNLTNFRSICSIIDQLTS